ncbi:MAG: tetratricopeptide repeat protein [Planctomycetes bacterium]|nr:tetratricopeptide repeat protein [Planctomycetota bacterium]
MSTRPIIMSALLVAGVLAGCAPTKKGLEARAKARERLNIINAQLSRDQAVQALEAGQFEKATKEIRQAIAMNPTWAEYHLVNGRIFLETHRLEKAQRSFEKALELRPDYPEAHYYSGIVYQRWSDDARAYDHYLSAFEQEPDRVPYLLAAAESLVALDLLDEASYLIDSKIVYFEHNAALHHLLGQIMLLRGDPAGAAQLYLEAWRLSPEDDLLLEELARTQYAAGMYGDCYRSVTLLQQQPDGDRPQLKRLEARCLAALDRHAEARNMFLELTKLDPTDTGLWIELGTVAWEIGDYHRMALCGARVAVLAPERFEGYLLKGVNERHHGNLAESIMFLRQAAMRAPEVALPHLLLGRVLDQAGDQEEALAAYATAVRIEPESEEAQLLWGDGQERFLLAQPLTDGARNE